MSITKTREFFSLPNVHYAFLLLCLFDILSSASPCYHVFTYFVHYVIMSSVLLLPCLCITLFFLSLFVILSENDYLCSEYV